MIYLFIIILVFLIYYVQKQNNFLFFINDELQNKANEFQKEELNEDIKILINCILGLLLTLSIAEVSILIGLISLLILVLYITKNGINSYKNLKEIINILKMNVEFAKKQEQYEKEKDELSKKISDHEVKSTIKSAIKSATWKLEKEQKQSKKEENINPIKEYKR